MTPGEALTLLAYAVGAAVFYWQAKERNYATDGIGIVVLIGLAAGAIGAKAAQLLVSQLPPGTPIWSLLDPRAGGRSVIAGVLIGWAAVEITKWKLGIKRSTGDSFALALAAGEAVGRIGCFLNPCCVGKACALPWAVHQLGADRHPAQLYQSALLAITFAILFALRNKLPSGALFQLYLALWGLGRFGVEFFRDGNTTAIGLTLAQIISLQTAILASAVFVYKLSRANNSEIKSYGNHPVP